MKHPFDQVLKAANEAKRRFGHKNSEMLAPIGVVLGSGLGAFADRVVSQGQSISYAKLPFFPQSSVEGHSGNLVFGQLSSTPVLVMQGRVHRYEGYTAQQVAFPIRVLLALGVKKLILTNASGGIGDHLEPGDLMLIKDHINLTGDNPCLGPNDLRFGPRFFDMGDTYTPALLNKAKELSSKMGFTLKEGVYAGVLGPSYETPAEIRMLKTIGADAVGMSTVFETIAARHGGAKILGISCITNKAAGLRKQILTHEEVQEIAKQTSGRFTELLAKLVAEL